ncbi:MAG TPA: hypothetical protein DCZ94_20920 [Lentisphaeria bacterium]|nr:MAG: hypothetical protein A2X48_23125 [Lentisphaerae bacterium GWF2_49_21]HBC89410.1 hypothetical protein [Lentisphaeria bacterium]
MGKIHLFLLVAFMFMFCTSCIEFERQDLWFRYDQKSDVLRIFSLYKGIFAEGEEFDGTEKQELSSVMVGGRTFFFSNWITEYHASKFKEMLDELSSNVKDEQEIAADYDKSAKAIPLEEYRKNWLAAKESCSGLLKLLLDNVSIQNGKFFIKEEGKLSGWQFVEIKNASELAKASNRAINQTMGILPDVDKLTELSPESIALWLKAGKENHQWLSFENGVLIVRIPLSQDDFVKFKHAKGREIASSQKESEGLGKLGSILESDWWVGWRNDEAVFNIGFSSQEFNHLGMPVFSGYKPNVIEWVKSEYGLLEQQPDIKTLRENFLKSGSVPDEVVTPLIPERR